MGQATYTHFTVKVLKDWDYFRLNITHPKFKGRIRKRLGCQDHAECENLAFAVRYELGKHFTTADITKSDVSSFIDNYVAMNVKGTASIFDYTDEFIEYKKDKTNKRTKSKLAKNTISGYATALQYFKNFLAKKRINPHPSSLTEDVMNNYYDYIDGSHNYKVKLHTKVKGFIKFLEVKKKLQIDPSYKLSSFTEQYDNQFPDETDIALPEVDIRKLIDLRHKILNNEIDFEDYRKTSRIPQEVVEMQFKMKKENIIKSLDCFLFMISFGMYHADIMKSKLNIWVNNDIEYISYRRAKNASLCNCIPIINDEIFIGGEIIKQYKIRNGFNFPLQLSHTHFCKHLKRISELAGLSYKLNPKMARKTFASILYFKRQLSLPYLQILLGHTNVKDTKHYLRINNYDIVNEIVNKMILKNL